MPALSLVNVFDAIAAKLAADAVVTAAGVPTISQLDPDFEKKYEAALRKADVARPGDGPGLLFTLWCTGGQGADGTESGDLDLRNGVILAVAESPKHNTSGKTALGWVLHLLIHLHEAGLSQRGARTDIRHPERGPAYELGALEQGLVVYFIHLEVRTFDALAG